MSPRRSTKSSGCLALAKSPTSAELNNSRIRETIRRASESVTRHSSNVQRREEMRAPELVMESGFAQTCWGRLRVLSLHRVRTFPEFDRVIALAAHSASKRTTEILVILHKLQCVREIPTRSPSEFSDSALADIDTVDL